MHERQTLLTAHDLRDHFQEAVAAAIDQQHLPLSTDSRIYLGDLLTEFSQTAPLFEGSESARALPPLTDLYTRAQGAATREARSRALRHLGDVALMVAGVFSGYLKRRLVDVDYYVAMGGSAYACLAGCRAGVYRELSEKFVWCMDAVAQACASHAPNTDVLRDYELWLRTGSPRLARRLAAVGVPVSGNATHLGTH